MDRMPLPPETFFEGTPPHVRTYIEQLHATIANLHTRIADLEAKQAKNSTNSPRSLRWQNRSISLVWCVNLYTVTAEFSWDLSRSPAGISASGPAIDKPTVSPVLGKYGLLCDCVARCGPLLPTAHIPHEPP